MDRYRPGHEPFRRIAVDHDGTPEAEADAAPRPAGYSSFPGPVAADERGHVADQGADRDGGEQGDDQRRVDGDEEDVDPDLLGVLQGDDDDDRDQGPDDPGPPVDRLLLLGHATILKPRLGLPGS